jgi:adenylosuccinate lyase
MEYRSLPCLGYTHGQPAQLVTVGKRASLWITDLLYDLRNLERARDDILNEFRGVKGTTGTQGSFLAIFKGNHGLVEKLDELVTKKAGFNEAEISTSQTYSRKIDVDIMHALGSFGCTAERIGGDIRHLAMFKEVEEPFEADQIGSSAMAYKRNPMRSERLCSLGRKLRNFGGDAEQTYASQWLERSLDDSAIRRITLPEGFLCADACIMLVSGAYVCDRAFQNLLTTFTAQQHLLWSRCLPCCYQEACGNGTAFRKWQRAVSCRGNTNNLPQMATENIIMAMVEKGYSRQDTHEEIRVLSHQAGAVVKQEGKDNDLIERIKVRPFFQPILAEIDTLTDPSNFVGRSPEIVEKLVSTKVKVALEKYKGQLDGDVVELNV